MTRPDRCASISHPAVGVAAKAHAVIWPCGEPGRAGGPRRLLRQPQLRAVVEAAQRRGIPVETHAHGDEGAANAVRAGVRSIEHGTFLSEPTLRMMKENSVWFVPTYSALADMSDAGGDYDDPGLQIRARYMVPQLRVAMERAIRTGVKFATGADTEYGRRSVARVAGEIAYLVDAGLTPLAAIQAATISGAELLGLDGLF